MLEALNKPDAEIETMLETEFADELRRDTMTKAERVEHELRSNSARSDREIGKVCGVDGKTVAHHRKRLSLGAVPSLEEAVASGAARVVNIAGPRVCPPPPGVVDEPKYDPFDKNGEDLTIPHQPAIAVFENTAGAITIIQHSDDPHDEDPIIIVRPENVEKLVARLRKVAEQIGG